MYRITWNPDNTRIASAGADGTARIWNVRTGAELRSFSRQSELNTTLAWSPDGTRLASGVLDEPVAIWEAESGELVRSLSMDDAVFCIAWSPDGKRLATAGNTSVRIWDMATGQMSATWRKKDTLSLAWSPDGTRLVGGTFGGELLVWETQTWIGVQKLRDRSSVDRVAWSPDGGFLATGTRAESITVWNTTSWEQIAVLRGHTDWVRAVSWSPDGNRLISASRDKSIKIWDIRNRETQSFALAGGKSYHDLKVCWNRKGDLLALGKWPKQIQIWNADSGQLLEELEPNGKPLAWADDDRHLVPTDSIDRWEEPRGNDKIPMVGGDISPNGRYAVKRAPSGTQLEILEVLTNRRLSSFDAEVPKTDGEFGLRVCWSPQSNRLATTRFDGIVRIWNARSGDILHELHGHEKGRWISALAWSPDGKQLASAGFDQVVKVWNVSDGTEVHTLRGHTGPMWTVAWNHAGTRLISGGFQGAIRLWDSVTGQETLTLAALPAGVADLAWSADDSRIAASCNNGTVTIWDASSEAVRQTARVEETD